MKVGTTRFGEVEVPEGEVYCFPDGLLGFGAVKIYFILQNPKGGPFCWLQAVDPGSLAFVVADPRMFLPDYQVKVRKEDLASIDMENVADGFVMVILTVPKDPVNITANLVGPLVFNPKKRLGKQLVLSDPGLSTRHRIFADPAPGGGTKSATGT